MKKHSLAIRLPLNRDLKQDAVLDELLSDKNTLSYSRTVEKSEDQQCFLETFNVVYVLNK